MRVEVVILGEAVMVVHVILGVRGMRKNMRRKKRTPQHRKEEQILRLRLFLGEEGGERGD